MSGHLFFKDRWYGFDDGLYAGARLLEILSRESDPSAALNALPDAVSTPELHMKTGNPRTSSWSSGCVRRRTSKARSK